MRRRQFDPIEFRQRNLKPAGNSRSSVLSKDCSLHAPDKFGGSFFQERAHAFREIGRAAGPPLKIAFEIELLVKAVGFGGIEGLLDQRQSFGGLAGEVGGEPVGLRHQLRVFHALPDHSPGLGFLGRNGLGKQNQRSRARAADESWQ